MSTNTVRYCTYFNVNYLLKGLALITSLMKHDHDAKIDVLCMDHETKKIIDNMQISGVTTHSLADFEDKELLKAKKTRSLVEYYWTCSPSLPLYIFRLYPKTKIVFYLDADLYFYSSPNTMIKEMGSSSIFVVEHRYPKEQRYINDISGRFNVAVNGFRRDKEGIECLKYWRGQCLDWCYHKYEKGRMGDQLYLNEWPKLYKNIVISDNIGVDAAPWNILRYNVSQKQGIVQINKSSLVAYHFHQLEYFSPYYTNYADGYQFSRATTKLIYKPYIRALTEQYNSIKKYEPDFKLPQPPPLSVRIKKIIDRVIRSATSKLTSKQ